MALHEIDEMLGGTEKGSRGWPWVLGRTAEARHGWRVARLAVRLGSGVGMRGAELRHLAWGALCHDMGKALVPAHLLSAPRLLDAAERRRVEEHPHLGAGLLRRLGAPRAWVEVALYHHERWDGGGYPHGLGGDEIPRNARLVAVADTYDAITESRPYQRARSHEEALGELRRVAGAQLEAALVEVFCTLPWRAMDPSGATATTLTSPSSRAVPSPTPSTLCTL